MKVFIGYCHFEACDSHGIRQTVIGKYVNNDCGWCDQKLKMEKPIWKPKS